MVVLESPISLEQNEYKYVVVGLGWECDKRGSKINGGG